MEILPKEILQRVSSINDIESIESCSRYWRLVSSDRVVYVLKKIYLSPCRVRDFIRISQCNIPGFQKIIHICSANTINEYWVLSEWVPGNTISPVFISKQNEEHKGQIKKVADILRNIHLTNQTNETAFWTEDSLRSILNCSFLNKNTQELLLSYMVDKLPIIQSRHCTIVHGDMHLRNIIVREDGNITFIDMDDIQYGDPYIDFVYASNLIRSADEYYTYYLLLNYYFENEIPADFWSIVNFYSIIKAINIMTSEAERSVDGLPILSMDGLISQHKGFMVEQPLWYSKLHKMFGRT